MFFLTKASILDRLSSTRYIGANLSDNLNSSAHVGYVSRKFTKYVSVILF